MKDEKYFGIVEGFFSRPLPLWTWEERRDTISFAGQYAKGINTYLYCPKNDDLVTKYPYQRYDNQSAREFKNLIKQCNANNVEFIYGFNPTLNEEELKDKAGTVTKILNKIKQFENIGCKSFCLLFDDMPIAYDVFDPTIGIENNVSNRIVSIVNEVFEAIQKEIHSFWFCSPDYCFMNRSSMTEAIKNLNKEIRIFWSGNAIFSKELKSVDLKRVEALTGNNKVALWSNYPVNDAEQNIGCFNLNGFYPIEKSVLSELDAVFVNPMREAYANLPFYITFSEYIEKQETYNRLRAWKNALKKLGVSNEAGALIEIFATSNAFDDSGVNERMYLQKQNEIAEKFLLVVAKTEYGKKFLKNINQVFIDIENYLVIETLVTQNKRIGAKEFEKIDWFPTVTTITRYFPEIYNIVMSRISMYTEPTERDDYSQFRVLKDTFKEEFKGKAVLLMSGEMDVRLRDAISTLIKLEQQKFVTFLNSSNNSAQQKLLTYFKRRSKNRFTL